MTPTFRPNPGDAVIWHCAIGPVVAEFRGYHFDSWGDKCVRLITRDGGFAEHSAPASQIAPLPDPKGAAPCPE